MKRPPYFPLFLILSALLALSGCNRQNSNRIDYQMGERVTIGPLTYNVIETVWRSQLGNTFKMRIPDQRYFLVTISVTNGGGKEVSVPLFTLENADGKSYQESSNGEGVDNWFGLLRNLAPAQTQQGRLLFDVPLSSYRLRLTDGGDPGTEKFAFVEIPLRLDTDTTVDSPLPGNLTK
jgi:hypothetical protein